MKTIKSTKDRGIKLGFLILVIVILVIVGLMFIQIKMNNFSDRVRQQALKGTGMSSSEIDAGIKEGMEKKQLERFLEEHKSFTEETLKDMLKEFTIQIIQRNSIKEFSSKVCEKVQNDSKIDKLQNMQFKRVNISHYNDSKIKAIAVYADNRDEYEIYLDCSLLNDTINLDMYQVCRGNVIGF